MDLLTVLLTKEASVREAAGLYLKKPAEHDLVAAMLNYGAYSQQYFGYNTGNLANEGLPNIDISSIDGNTIGSSYAYNKSNPNIILPQNNAGVKGIERIIQIFMNGFIYRQRRILIL
ncbi:MAG: hypothetical protein IK999_14790 [Ruminococcus sp.]|nr:hypothetical protein [Ruminococcus sp.]